jgi:hypothetical protein
MPKNKGKVRHAQTGYDGAGLDTDVMGGIGW